MASLKEQLKRRVREAIRPPVRPSPSSKPSQSIRASGQKKQKGVRNHAKRPSHAKTASAPGTHVKGSKRTRRQASVASQKAASAPMSTKVEVQRERTRPQREHTTETNKKTKNRKRKKKKEKKKKKKKKEDPGAAASHHNKRVKLPTSAETPAPAVSPLRQPSALSASSSSTSSSSSSSSSSSAQCADTSAAPPFYPFPVEYGDHFESPPQAYADLAPVLRAMCAMLVPRAAGKASQELCDNFRIYDPFFCMGAVVGRLHALGFRNVIHRCEDFYKVLKRNKLPVHDVMVTNPPYSGNHKERVLKHCASTGKPFCLLLPNYVATKGYYTRTMQQHNLNPFFIVPTRKYEYTHPEGTGHETSPFTSYWIVSMGERQRTRRLYQAAAVEYSKDNHTAARLVWQQQLQSSRLVPWKKRKSPRRRKAERKRKLAALSAST